MFLVSVWGTLVNSFTELQRPLDVQNNDHDILENSTPINGSIEQADETQDKADPNMSGGWRRFNQAHEHLIYRFLIPLDS